MRTYLELIRFDKPIGWLLLLYPTLWAFSIAERGAITSDNIWILIVFSLGTFLMRSCGCIFNDIADRNFDDKVERTKNRPITSGKISVKSALIFGIFLALSALLLLLTLVNQVPPLTFILALPALFLAISYPYTKRFFPIPQLYLGTAFSFGIPMISVALNGHLTLSSWVLFIANVIWTIGYDTAYAMVDKEDDLKIGIKSSAITFGKFDFLAVGLSFCSFLLFMSSLVWIENLGYLYISSIVLAGLLSLYQFKLLLTRLRVNYFLCFKLSNYTGLTLLIGLTLDQLRTDARPLKSATIDFTVLTLAPF